MQREVATLRHTVGGLQGDLQASSQLLKELTEQNLQLIRRVERIVCVCGGRACWLLLRCSRRWG